MYKRCQRGYLIHKKKLNQEVKRIHDKRDNLERDLGFFKAKNKIIWRARFFFDFLVTSSQFPLCSSLYFSFIHIYVVSDMVNSTPEKT